jgi:hypothetical protein
MLAAMVTVGVLEAVGHLIFPLPPGTDPYDPEQLRAIMDKIPPGAMIAVLMAWGAGSLVGGFTAAAIAGRAHVVHALIVGGLQFACSVITMLMIPHPLWFLLASIVIVVPSSWLGAKVAKALLKTPPPGPQPYDMREKNMAC